MRSIQPQTDHETIFIHAESLFVHVIGTGKNSNEILARLRAGTTHALPVNNTVAVHESLPRNDFVFLLSDTHPIGEANIAALDEHLDGIVPALTLVFFTGDGSNPKPNEIDHFGLILRIDGYVHAPSEPCIKLKTESIFGIILGIAETIDSPGAINVDQTDFCRALIGTSAKRPSMIWASMGEATNPERAIRATENALALPLFIKQLTQTDGLVIKITGNQSNLMGREVKEVMAELRRHIPECCNCVCSVCYDEKMPPEMLRVNFLASQWAS